MSAAIHPFPGRDPNLGIREAGDDLLAELAVAVGAHPVAAGQSVRRPRDVREPTTPADLGTGAHASVHPIGAARQGGANDLVAIEALAGPALRRHHLVLVAASIVLAVVIALLTGFVGANADGDIPVAGVTSLEDGETLWGMASEITPVGGDVRDTVALLLELNDFDSPTLPVGTLVRLPAVDG